MFFGSPGMGELLVVFVVVLLVFGSSRVPEFARMLGRAIREFKKIVNEVNTPDDPDATDDGPRSSRR
ncbi:MAG: twin-arginine translocase TatA/TatE family subunit [Candidatus Omnitrophica bacterium]|nr:twin-arginine translocase TatA/TatE family subunit [Candidatus Omnitrophota bacterium]